jgi:fibronectin-binding autotransporter adhesin
MAHRAQQDQIKTVVWVEQIPVAVAVAVPGTTAWVAAGGSGIVVIRHSYTQTTYSNHNLTINSGAGAVDMNGNVSHIGTLSVNSTSAASEISGIIDGVTALTKQGAGTLTLSGTNTYTGSTTISAGTISVASSANLGATPGSADADNIIFNGGTLTTTASFT